VSLDNIMGHREASVRLALELRTRPSHAYLFTGPRGIGKSIVATGMAHLLLCERAQDASFCCNPIACPVREAAAKPTRGRGAAVASARCDCCAACVQAASGVHPDLLRIGRAANRAQVLIEQVRELIAQLALKPARGGVRVAIIDDADSLNIPAQNALLKTLEEPPGHSIVFVIAAAERILLDTVRSRLRRVSFGALDVADIVSILRAKGGDPKQAEAIALLARGSAGRAIALAGGDAPPLDAILEALGSARGLDFARAQAIAQEHFATREAASANFELIARLLEEILVAKLGVSGDSDAAPERSKLMSSIAAKTAPDSIARCIGMAVRCAAAVDAMANPRMQAEQFWMEAARAMREES
jgi:DNA polymerase-3 subunit delta'